MNRRDLFTGAAGLVAAGAAAKASAAPLVLPDPEPIYTVGRVAQAGPNLSQVAKTCTLQRQADEARASLSDAMSPDEQAYFETKSRILAAYCKSDLMANLPLLTVMGGAYAHLDIPRVDRLRISGGDLDVDMAAIKRYGSDYIEATQDQQLRALVKHLDKVIIEGQTAKDPRQPDGLFNRTKDQPEYRTLKQGLEQCVVEDASPSVPGANAILMTKEMSFSLTRRDIVKWRSHGERTVPYLGKLRVLTDYRLGNDDRDSALNRDEGFTRMFIMRLSAEDGVCMLDHGDLEVMLIGEAQEKPVHRTRVEWLMSLTVLKTDAVRRVCVPYPQTYT